MKRNQCVFSKDGKCDTTFPPVKGGECKREECDKCQLFWPSVGD